MLIELDRDVIEGQLKHGWYRGLYWRAVRAYTMNHGVSMQAGVYIQVLVPYSRFNIGLLRLCDAGGLPAMYNTDAGSCGDLHRVQHCFGGFASHLPTQWYESPYGMQYFNGMTQLVTKTTIHREWYPGPAVSSNVDLLPELFLEYIKPTAEHVCLQISRALEWPEVSPAYVHPDPDRVLALLETPPLDLVSQAYQ